jgi:hypothetical protein
VFPANDYVIRAATAADETAIQHLSGPGPRLPGRVLIGEIAGSPAAALSLADGRLVADPRARTAQLGMRMRIRAAAIRAFERTPSVSRRLRNGVRVATR